MLPKPLILPVYIFLPADFRGNALQCNGKQNAVFVGGKGGDFALVRGSYRLRDGKSYAVSARFYAPRTVGAAKTLEKFAVFSARYAVDRVEHRNFVFLAVFTKGNIYRAVFVAVFQGVIGQQAYELLYRVFVARVHDGRLDIYIQSFVLCRRNSGKRRCRFGHCVRQIEFLLDELCAFLVHFREHDELLCERGQALYLIADTLRPLAFAVVEFNYIVCRADYCKGSLYLMSGVGYKAFLLRVGFGGRLYRRFRENADKDKTGNNGFLLILLALIGAAGVGAYYFKIILPKKKLEQADDIEDFEFEGYDEDGEESELDNDDEDYSDDTEE